MTIQYIKSQYSMTDCNSVSKHATG